MMFVGLLMCCIVVIVINKCKFEFIDENILFFEKQGFGRWEKKNSKESIFGHFGVTPALPKTKQLKLQNETVNFEGAITRNL